MDDSEGAKLPSLTLMVVILNRAVVLIQVLDQSCPADSAVSSNLLAELMYYVDSFIFSGNRNQYRKVMLKIQD